MGKLKLERRTYEDRAVRNLRKMLPKHKRVVMVSPTGSGKTVMAALLLKREPRWKRVLWLAHRHELIDQAYATLTQLGIQAGVLMAQDERLHGQERVDPDARVQVASVQTIDRRGGPKGVGLVVIDEAHRVMASSYQRIVQQYGRAQVLGLTATPVRMDGRELGAFFREMLVVAQPSELYKSGHLAEPIIYGATEGVLAEIGEGLKGATTSSGDYSPKTLAAVGARKRLIGYVVDEAIRLAPKVPKVVFAASVRQSRLIARNFNRKGVRAEHVDANTPAEDRERILAQLASGAIEVVVNVDILSEGYDLPALGAVILARPTKSLPRYLQMCGRVQRPYKGRDPVIIDHGKNVNRFLVAPGEDIPWSLSRGAEVAYSENPRIKECFSCLRYIPYGTTECPECGEEQPKTERQLAEEEEARLQKITRKRLDEMRQRLEVLAKKKNAPPGWVDKVMHEVQAWG